MYTNSCNFYQYLLLIEIFLCSKKFRLETINHRELGEILWRHKDAVEQVAVQCLRVTHPLSSFQKTIMMGKRERLKQWSQCQCNQHSCLSDVIQASAGQLASHNIPETTNAMDIITSIFHWVFPPRNNRKISISGSHFLDVPRKAGDFPLQRWMLLSAGGRPNFLNKTV